MTEREVAVEFLVEPFLEGTPGDHVDAAIQAFSSRGLDVKLGPFSSISTGSLDNIGEAVGAMVVDAMHAGASSITVQIATSATRLGHVSLHDALDGMMRAAERELGTDVTTWNRSDKQRVVRMLDERGAFLLRGAVDDIANAMGVSRITIYNYLNAISATPEESST